MLRAASPEPALKLGVMDFWSPLELTFRLAPLVESLGYRRYWLAAHPPQPNPQIAAALIAGLTQNIRVGTAGMCLSVHNAFQLANDFLLLERVFPGRIDAGFCGGGAVAGLSGTVCGMYAATDDRDLAVLEEEAVAGGTGRHAAAA